LARAQRLPGPDESTAFEGPVRALGGPAANIAVYAAALGAPVLLSSFVGEDFPPEFERQLRRRGVDTRHLVKVSGAPTPVCWIFTDASERQAAFINQGAAKSPAARRVPRAAVERAQIVHLATGEVLHHQRAAALARRLGKRVAFDPGQELSYAWTAGTFRKMLSRTDTLFLNEGECRQALAYLGLDRAPDLLKFVQELILTHGRRGSEYLSATVRVRVRAAKAKRVVNTTGAGDAFRGGYYAAHWRGLPPRERLLWGGAAASFAVESESGQDLVPDEHAVLGRVTRIGSAKKFRARKR
jgi:sugar/nucleoside kinase (ribokinase family)